MKRYLVRYAVFIDGENDPHTAIKRAKDHAAQENQAWVVIDMDDETTKVYDSTTGEELCTPR